MKIWNIGMAQKVGGQEQDTVPHIPSQYQGSKSTAQTLSCHTIIMTTYATFYTDLTTHTV